MASELGKAAVSGVDNGSNLVATISSPPPSLSSSLPGPTPNLAALGEHDDERRRSKRHVKSIPLHQLQGDSEQSSSDYNPDSPAPISDSAAVRKVWTRPQRNKKKKSKASSPLPILPLSTSS
jgi:hypothetical protein